MRYIHELYEEGERILRKNGTFLIPRRREAEIGTGAGNAPKKTIHLLALGDVGGMLLIGLRLLGAEVCRAIGIWDIHGQNMDRYEQEGNQIIPPEREKDFPPIYRAEDLFDCDVFLFCATAGVPPVEDPEKQAAEGRRKEGEPDVRMAQFASNRLLVEQYASQAVKEGYQGMFFVVSDPVDPLCRVAMNCGLGPAQIRGFGLGVMDARAAYYDKTGRYRREGRVYGPHGEDLVVADSVVSYDHEASLSLTQSTIEANKKVRALGFKPYIAPALSSGALSILAALGGDWHYSSVCFGRGFLGVRNKMTTEGDWVEDLPLDDRLFRRIETSYEKIKAIE